jgi:acylphosphatase
VQFALFRLLVVTAGTADLVAVLHAVVRGRVQGVGFRWFVRERARALGVRGWVRNRSDGSVEVEAEGDAGTLEQLRELLWNGPAGAHVRAVDEVGGGSAGERPYPFAIVR